MFCYFTDSLEGRAWDSFGRGGGGGGEKEEMVFEYHKYQTILSVLGPNLVDSPSQSRTGRLVLG